jgi:hypothetical protein
MSLKTIVTNVANEAGYTVDSNIISSTDVTTKQLKAIASRVSREMAYAYPWPQMYASASITIQSGVASYPLPSAFSWYHYETFWNSSTRWRILGPMSPQEYAELRGYGLNVTVYQRFQIKGIGNNQLFISPTPPSQNNGNVIIFEYIAERSVKPADWASGTTFAASAYTFNDGNYYVTTAGGVSGSTAPTHTSGSASDGGVTWTYYNGPYNDFLADTDQSVFNEKTLELGVLERFAEIHGLDTIQPRFLAKLDEDYSKKQHSKILYAGGHTRAELFARNGTAVFGTWT